MKSLSLIKIEKYSLILQKKSTEKKDTCTFDFNFFACKIYVNNKSI